MTTQDSASDRPSISPEEIFKSWLEANFLMIDGAPVISEGIASIIPENINEGEVNQARLKEANTYNVRNNIIAFVDEFGRCHIAPKTETRIRMLETSGYQSNYNAIVPLADGQELTDSSLRARWDKMVQDAEQEENERAQREGKEQFKQVAGRRKVR